tara:strand:- start:144 stop:407 length:264 start_codon:yes stop_codon:yes gene_type:complete
MKKYRLYSTLSGWTARKGSLETHLGIPNGKGTLCYAEVSQVENPDNADYEKYIMPVCTSGTWVCDDQFNASDLVDFDPEWNPVTPPG